MHLTNKNLYSYVIKHLIKKNYQLPMLGIVN